jgi:hypothetical protein
MCAATCWPSPWPAGEYGQPPEFFNNPQMHSYEHCLQSYGPQHQFLGGLLYVLLIPSPQNKLQNTVDCSSSAAVHAGF